MDNVLLVLFGIAFAATVAVILKNKGYLSFGKKDED